MSIFQGRNKIKIGDYFNVTTTGNVTAGSPLTQLYDGDLNTSVQHNGGAVYKITFELKDIDSSLRPLKTVLGIRLYNKNSTYGITDFKFLFYSNNVELQSQTFSSITPGSAIPHEVTVGKSIDKIVFQITGVNNSTLNTINELEIYGIVEPLINFEFNDSVLETKAWNSSRYDGRQLTAQKLNKISRNDIGNNNKTPIIRNYTRNIYLGNEIVGMSENGGDDASLVQFPDFSYAQITTYITVNEDGSLTRNTLDPEENNDNQKKAFYRPFMYDFPEGSFCNFILGDPTVKNNLKSKYPIYFNGGQLKKLVTLQTQTNGDYDVISGNVINKGYTNGGNLTTQRFDSSHASITGAVNVFDSNDPPQRLDTNQGALYIGGLKETVTIDEDGDASFPTYVSASEMIAKLDNENIYSNFYTGSLKYEQGFYNGGIPHLGSGVDLTELKTFSQNLVNYKANSDYKGDKRFFITVAKYHNDNYFAPRPGNPKPLYTFEPGNIHTASLGINDINLSSLTTLEVDGVDEVPAKDDFNIYVLEFTFNPNISKVYINGHTYYSNLYYPGDPLPYSYTALNNGLGEVPNLLSGSFMFSITEDDTPSLLVPLKKETDLPEDKGERPFVVIPENIHPYVKDNLIFYLSKAGIDIGGNATDQVKEDLGKKPRASKLSPRELRLLALERLRQNQERRKTIETARRDRRRAITRREDREERRKRRVENRQERRKNRKDRKENRQENRQERRRNRRNRRRRR